jgi:uncharacterized protein (DUF983 family)
MANCNKCGREIPRKTGVYKVIRTGRYSAGGDYYRNVSLCDKCAQDMETEAVGKQKQKSLLMIVGVVVVVILAVYFYMQYR